MKINFNLENNYEGNLEFSFEEIKKLIPDIFENLLKIDKIAKSSCFSDFNFNTLSFDILFIDDKKIKDINFEYRNINNPTDVITFALFADDINKFVLDNDIYLGEILISVDTAKKQAINSVQIEILTLIIHGLLHLFGFDHQTDEDYNFVVDVQNRIVESL